MIGNAIQAIAGSDELVIREHTDKAGNTYYSMYDPISGLKSIADTEAEVRVWIEKHLYR